MTRRQIKQQSTVPESQNIPQLDFSALMASAESIVQNIQSGNKESMDMNKLFEQVTETLIGDKMDPASKQQMKLMSKLFLDTAMENIEPDNNVVNLRNKSKINLEDNDDSEDKMVHSVHSEDKMVQDKIPQKNENVEELDSDTEVDELRPIADDVYYKLPVTLDELYTGKTKKLLITRDRLDKSGKKVITEKRKIEVPVFPGMKHNQEIRFNKEGNEKYGCRSGDIIITLAVNSHNMYERIGDTLHYVQNISLYESYAAAQGLINIVIKHLDGSFIVLKVDDKVPLHAKNGARKIRNGGMPIFNKKTRKTEYGDLYIRFNLILPESFDGDKDFTIIEKLFPVLPINKDSIVTKGSSFNSGSSKIRDVLLEELTLEDMEQLDYDEENSDSESDSDSESCSE